jgi:hypothetical protein
MCSPGKLTVTFGCHSRKEYMLSLTDKPGGNAHKHTVVSEQLRELISESLEYLRMKCSERGYFNSSAKKNSPDIKSYP